MQYRKDIDGLRAVAVLLVVVFHVYPHKITGGFIGVDVFFVISGFLITSLICGKLREGDFRLLDFYSRRIRRIFPALALVLATCMALGWLLLFPADYRNIGEHVAASAGFVANFTLWRDAGYFADPSELKPVLHLWSLGIEEQFYILWPTLLLIAWRWRRTSAGLAAAILAASFVCNLVVAHDDSVSAFFLPTTRFWELMIGCLLALALPQGALDRLGGRGSGRAATLCDAASLLGGLLIAAAAILIDSGRAFPGWWALLPTLGAALLIAAGPGAFVNRQLLSRSAAVQLGLISYPLYLWHWPILAFLRHYHFKEPSDLMRWSGVVLAVVLAACTYRFVEQPIRRGASLASKTAGPIVAMVLVGGLGLAAFAEHGWEGRFPQQIAVLFKDEDNVAKVFIGSGRCLRENNAATIAFTTDCALPPGSPLRQVVVWGDSHGSNIARGLAELARTGDAIHVVFFNTVGCPPSPSYAFTHPGLPNCPSANRTAVAGIEALKADTVILAGNWGSYDGGPNAARVDQGSIREAVERLKAMGIKRIVGVGQFPLWDYAVPKLMARRYRDRRAASLAAAAAFPVRSLDDVKPLTFISDERVGQWFRAAGAAFVSPLATLCDRTGCLMTVPGHIDPMERDEDHLTNAGAIWFAGVNRKALLESP